MTYDTDTRHQNTTPPAWPAAPKTAEEKQEEMLALCADLLETLSQSASGADDLLTRQAALLDQLLYAVMRKSLQTDLKRGYFDEAALLLALRIQKQCADTVKAGAAIDYMKHLGLPPLPHPHKIEKRNE
ncbi:MAG: hypothetical protein KDJ35_07070 [Alphaproteobacteria bacterium]|nr:hypothetical protein [Alphaproteobacteria bacterium]